MIWGTWHRLTDVWAPEILTQYRNAEFGNPAHSSGPDCCLWASFMAGLPAPCAASLAPAHCHRGALLLLPCMAFQPPAAPVPLLAGGDTICLLALVWPVLSLGYSL